MSPVTKLDVRGAILTSTGFFGTPANDSVTSPSFTWT